MALQAKIITKPAPSKRIFPRATSILPALAFVLVLVLVLVLAVDLVPPTEPVPVAVVATPLGFVPEAPEVVVATAFPALAAEIVYT